jgi:N-acetyl-anhydromuramyl-L-alanine amidase AmpD
MRGHSQFGFLFFGLLTAALLAGCAHVPPPAPGAHLERRGDEIVAAGQFFHIGTPVVLWMDPGGYDAYRVERRFSPLAKADWADSKRDNPNLTSPNRYGLRRSELSSWEAEQLRGGGWDLLTLERAIDQFVIHFDAAGTSRQCFKVLQDERDLSVHFMLDVDGTIYQTLDLKERAWHASQANSRSIGIEIANIGAYPLKQRAILDRWYKQGTNGTVDLVIPPSHQPSGIRTENFTGHPARTEQITGRIQGEELVQYDFTPRQYDALIKLTAALCKIFPNLKCDYPHDAQGRLIRAKLSPEDWKAYHGLLGHYHVQSDKVDPGPAFQWDRVIDGARKYLNE